VTELYVQRDQPPGVPPLHLTGERTLPDVPEENYWYQRHLVVYRWIAERVDGLHVVDVASGEGYGADENDADDDPRSPAEPHLNPVPGE